MVQEVQFWSVTLLEQCHTGNKQIRKRGRFVVAALKSLISRRVDM